MANSSQVTSICNEPRRQADRLLNAARKTGDRRQEAAALTDLGVVELQARNYARAISDLEEAVKAACDLGDEALANDALAHLGIAYLATNQWQRAGEILQEQVAKAQTRGDALEEKFALTNLAAFYAKQNDFAKALDIYKEAAALASQDRDEAQHAELLWLIAIQYAGLGDRDQAVAFGQESIAIYTRIGAPYAREMADKLADYSSDPSHSNKPLPPMGYYTGPDVSTQESQSSILWMALAATKSLAKFLGSGFTTVTTIKHEQRLEVCGACPRYSGVRCKLCGCFASIKAWLPYERCPIGNWLD